MTKTNANICLRAFRLLKIVVWRCNVWWKKLRVGNRLALAVESDSADTLQLVPWSYVCLAKFHLVCNWLSIELLYDCCSVLILSLKCATAKRLSVLICWYKYVPFNLQSKLKRCANDISWMTIWHCQISVPWQNDPNKSKTADTIT